MSNNKVNFKKKKSYKKINVVGTEGVLEGLRSRDPY